jgi:hypothetical protein
MTKTIRSFILTILLLLPKTLILPHQTESAYHTFSHLTTITRNPEFLTIPEDITCQIVDLKYDGKNIKILEFGDFFRAGFYGYFKLFEPEIIPKRMYNYLKQQFGLPIFHVGKLGSIGAGRGLIGRFTESIYTLKKDPVFKKLIRQKTNGDQKIGIVGIPHHPIQKNAILTFKKDYPQFIVINDVATHFVDDKHKTALLFNTPELQQYRPLWKTYKKRYSSTLAQTIINDFKSVNTFVIKPICGNRGRGILMVDKHQLDETLHTILTNKRQLLKIKDDSYSWWYHDKKDDFLVEEYAASKPIAYNGKKYDGTIRMVFVLSKHEEAIQLTFLAGYWKLPFYSLDDKMSLTDRLKSKHGREQPSAALTESENISVESLLSKCLPKMYQNMFIQQKST